MKLCYYKVLGVECDSSDSDIKTAYRKLALKWHPDKNPDDLEAAKEQFQCIQEAYEVLSDPHERAWYDKHREQILRGKNSNYEDQCLDVYKYFSTSCFEGYEDDARGFYTVYRQVFVEISTEEADFISDEQLKEIPTFGNSKSLYEDVVAPFYAYWSAYCTKKSYTWLCEYDIKEIKDRQILRKIEKDMKKVVLKARKMRNDEIRNLVSFVRKRDKRVQAYNQMLEEKAALNRQKQKENRMERLKRRQRELSEMQKSNKIAASATQLADYEKSLKELERMYSNNSDQSDQEDNDSLVENASFERLADKFESELSLEHPDNDIYCVACNRSFKNVKAFANHDKSRRHRENERLLKKQMQAEEALFKQNYENLATNNECTILDVDLDVESAETDDISEDSDQLNVNKDEDIKNNRKENVTKVFETKFNENRKISKPENLQDTFITKLKSNRKNQKTDSENSDNEIWTNSNKKMNKNNKKRRKAQISTNNENNTASNVTNAKDATNCDSISNNKKCPDADVDQNAANICATCKANFPSKNKLFAHLKLTNHAVYIQTKKDKVLENPTSKALKANKSKKNKN